MLDGEEEWEDSILKGDGQQVSKEVNLNCIERIIALVRQGGPSFLLAAQGVLFSRYGELSMEIRS